MTSERRAGLLPSETRVVASAHPVSVSRTASKAAVMKPAAQIQYAESIPNATATANHWCIVGTGVPSSTLRNSGAQAWGSVAASNAAAASNGRAWISR